MLSDVRSLAARFSDVFEQSHGSSLVTASKEEELRAYEFFRNICSDVTEHAESIVVNQQFCTLAAEKFCDMRFTPERFLETNAEQVTPGLTDSLLRWFVKDRLNPAVEICARSTAESPQDVELRLDTTLDAVRFSEIVKKILGSSKPVRAPRTRSINSDDPLDTLPGRGERTC